MSAHTTSEQSGDARSMQERLHELISRISDTTDVVKGWPESAGDDASIHVKTTTKLINSIREIIKALERVEGVAKKDEILWKRLKECPIPLDLLELMDCGGGLNPEMFMRGLLREALSQLAGLRRRKVALEMLGTAIETGLEKKKLGVVRETEGGKTSGSKRSRDDDQGTNTDAITSDESKAKREREE
mmetsp:Transcript_32007/g.47257  ORF Transcript_32007/g.47257 Transcript_32007/m.47257 type:complete len:188 (+) Transcript_32007:77-640(+)|eukprot:CAMPEP_0194221750 /NCGR_PEP_ID=MMETSP0156-20130528/31267_1 /TAXON_ID=33649 /ORGANISM="Thalassionema nitzschioides, Strain L26-B" /LENGTH=187 /DNA_ID=CAMNT_0038952259 /DNA_START=13 /DNA_END=576 /DNA_ORIENTATION=-